MSFYDDASWLMIPSGIKEDIVFAQKPTSGLGDLTFTRASDATYTDASGVVRRSPYNLLTYSEMFTDASWTRTDVAISANTTTAPNGTLTADKITPNTTNTNHILSQAGFTFLSGIAYTFSYYAKSDGYTKTAIRIGGAGYATVPRAEINLATGAIIYQQGFTNLSVTSAANGFYRISGTFISGTGLVPNIQPLSDSYTVSLNNYVYAGDGTSGIIAWGAQLVEGSSALDYFPTTNRQDVPRIDFRNADGTLSSCGRLLLEPQRTNSVPYSEQFDNAAWEKVSSTITANTTTAPSGTLSADLFVPASGSTGRVAETTGLAVVNTTVYTGSIYFKKPTLAIDNITFYASDTSAATGTNRFGVTVNLTNFTGVAYNFGNGVATSVSVISVGDGWYRAIFTGSVSSGATLNWAFVARVFTVNASINGTNGLQLWGAQLEAGAYVTTYIPTTTAAVTRIKDDASKTGVSSLIGQTEGTLFLDFVPTNVTTTSAFGISTGANANRIIIYTGSSLLLGQVTTSSVNIFLSNTTPAAIGNRYRAALAYKANDFAFYINGVQIATGNSGIPPATSVITCSTGDGTVPFYATMNQAALFPTRLTNAQLAQLTTL